MTKKHDFITLGQFMKLHGLINSGGEAKIALTQLDVTVNGEKEARRGRKLYDKDVVVIDGERFVVKNEN